MQVNENAKNRDAFDYHLLVQANRESHGAIGELRLDNWLAEVIYRYTTNPPHEHIR